MLSLMVMIEHGLAKRVISIKCHQMWERDTCLQQIKEINQETVPIGLYSCSSSCGWVFY